MRWLVNSDVNLFRQAIANQNWQKIIEIYQADFLENLQFSKSASFEAWVLQERFDLERAWQNASNSYLEILEKNDEYEKAKPLLEKLLKREPLAEDILQRYLRTCYLLNKKNLALKTFEDFNKLLKNELGLEPLDETIAIIETIKSSKEIIIKEKQEKRKSIFPLRLLRPPELIGRKNLINSIKNTNTKTIFIHGEAGIGKSRLISELIPQALTINCQESLENIPFYPITNLIRQLLEDGIQAPDLKHYNDDLVRLVPELNPKLSPSPSHPETGKARLFEALSLYFNYLLNDKKLKLEGIFIDDLQWADSSSLDFIAYLSNRHSFKIFGAYRTSEINKYSQNIINALKSSGLLTLFRLEPLSVKELNKLLASLMNNKLGGPIFSQWLAKNTGGNPMFVLETIKTLFETGVLESKNDYWQTDIDSITTDYSEIKIPTAIKDIIKRRIAKLKPETQRVLRVASVINYGFEPTIISKISGLSEWSVFDAFEEASKSAIINNNRFSHDLLRQSVYNSLSKSQQKNIHFKLANLLKNTADSSIVAEHFFAADHIHEATEIWLIIANEMSSRGLGKEALEILERAKILVDNAEQLLIINIKIADIYKQLAKFRESESLLKEIAKNKPQGQLKIEASLIHIGNLIHLGNLKEAKEVLDNVYQLNKYGTKPSLELSLRTTQATIYSRLGKHKKALQSLAIYLPQLEHKSIDTNMFFVITSLAATYDNLNKQTNALKLHYKALNMAKQIGSKHYQVEAILNLLYCLMDLNRSSEGLKLAEEVLSFGEYEGSDILRNNVAAAYSELANIKKANYHFTYLTQNSNDPSILCIAWARLARLQKLAKEQTKSFLKNSLKYAKATDLYIAHAHMLISIYKFSDPELVNLASDYLKPTLEQNLPTYILLELEQYINK